MNLINWFKNIIQRKEPTFMVVINGSLPMAVKAPTKLQAAMRAAWTTWGPAEYQVEPIFAGRMQRNNLFGITLISHCPASHKTFTRSMGIAAVVS
jgi:hypothetical protein